MADHHHVAAAKAGEPTEDRLIVGKGAVSGQWREAIEQARDIMFEVRTFGMPGDLRLLPGRQPSISVAHQLVGFRLQASDLRIDVHRSIGGGVTQLIDAAPQLGDGFFKIEKACHQAGSVRAPCARRQRVGVAG